MLRSISISWRRALPPLATLLGDVTSVSHHRTITSHQRRHRSVHVPHATSSATAPEGTRLDFADPRSVFESKSMVELVRALVVLKLCSMDWFVDHSLPLLRRCERLLGERLLHQLVSPFYNQFVPGAGEPDLARVAAQLRQSGVRLVFAHMLEDDLGDQQTLDSFLDANLATTLQQFSMIPRVMEPAERPCTLFKLTGLVPCHTLAAVSSLAQGEALRRHVEGVAEQMAGGPVYRLPVLSREDQAQWDQGLRRVMEVGRFCEVESIRLMVDGEYTYTNPAIALLALALAANFNRKVPLVWGTYQCYLKDSEASLKNHLKVVDDIGICYGVKLVRGAYLEKEVARATQLGLPRPIHDGYGDTSDNYNSQVARMLRRIAAEPHRFAVIVASHNEESIRRAVGLMTELGLPKDDGTVLFGQTYGVYEQVSVQLARAGYAVYKSTPLGDLHSIMPYLARRAAENRTVARGTRSERRLLGQEIRRRLSLSW